MLLPVAFFRARQHGDIGQIYRLRKEREILQSFVVWPAEV